MSNQLEIEIKSLLGNQENAEILRKNIRAHYPDFTLRNEEKQLNHYFQDGNLSILSEKIAPRLTDDQRAKLRDIVEKAAKHSVRTRWIDKTNEVILVIKASLNADSSANGVSRIEFEASFHDMSLSELDNILLDSGFRYLSKWSRERTEYDIGHTIICLDKNAGYGYVAEFERVIPADGDIHAATTELKSLMDQLGATELPQDRLERMFAYYNANWPGYYGTEKVFNIE